MSEGIDARVVGAAIEEAKAQGRDPGDVPLDDIARRAGVSRATLYRRIGSRATLDDAVRAAGVDPGGRPAVQERALTAAAALIAEEGLGMLTLEAIAARAECSLPALYDRFGNREGLLTAVFERYSPILRFEALLAAPPPSFEDGVRGIYAAAFDAATAQPRLIGALVSEALARPDGPIARQIEGTYGRRALGVVGGWLTREIAAGRCRPLPLPLLIQLLMGPMILHAPTRGFVEGLTGQPLPSRETVIETMTGAYCRAVALPRSGARDPTA